MILVTGGGFIGSALAQKFGDDCLIISRSKRGANIINFDLTQTESVSELITALDGRQVSHVIHAAGVTPWAHDGEFSDNKKIAETIAQFCNEAAVEALLYTSGWIVYDMSGDAPYDEKTVLGPTTDYGKSQFEVERVLAENLRTTKLVNLRLASVYGPGQMSSGLIPNLVSAALSSGVMRLNAAETKRDYVYIEDVVSAIGQILSLPFNETVTNLNIGSGKGQSVRGVAEAVKEVVDGLGRDCTIEFSPTLQESEPIDNTLDIRQARKLSLLASPTSLQDGIHSYVLWREQQS